mmetsp:Transcript_46893/g.98175  ORF Transcript_46893/g.98175 Transcript_46893/m.98175 type:complete len:96 (+) Transcript_46893:140-427(+)
MNDTVDGTVPSDSRDNVQTRTDLVVGTIPDLYAPDQDLNNTLALAIQMICDSQGSQRCHLIPALNHSLPEPFISEPNKQGYCSENNAGLSPIKRW